MFWCSTRHSWHFYVILQSSLFHKIMTNVIRDQTTHMQKMLVIIHRWQIMWMPPPPPLRANLRCSVSLHTLLQTNRAHFLINILFAYIYNILISSSHHNILHVCFFFLLQINSLNAHAWKRRRIKRRRNAGTISCIIWFLMFKMAVAAREKQPVICAPCTQQEWKQVHTTLTKKKVG